MKAAHELFVERDYDEVSTDEILARSGVSRGAMYHHFPAKLDLFRAVYEASEQRAIGLVADELATASDPFAALLLGALIEAAMLIVVAEDPAVARERSEAVVVDLIEGLRSQPGTVCSG